MSFRFEEPKDLTQTVLPKVITQGFDLIQIQQCFHFLPYRMFRPKAFTSD